MTKTRVSYGEKFWFFRIDGKIAWGYEYEDLFCTDLFNCGNYFQSKEEIESMSRKFRSVLNGADVIEMPSKEEITENIFNTAGEVVGREGEITVSHCMKTAKVVVEWLNSKIVN